MKLRHFLGAAWILGLLGLSWALHGRAARCESEADEAGQRLLRIQQDQPDLYEIRERARQAQRRIDLDQALSRQASQQRLLLQAVQRLNWSYLEWEPEGFYLETARPDNLKSVFPEATVEPNRIAGLWP